MDFSFLAFLLSYGFIGGIAGLLGAFLGIGGGMVAVPCLLLVFSLAGFSEEHVMHLAIGTSLASMTINTLASTYFHHKKGSVVWSAIIRSLLGICLGSVGGALFARLISGDILQILFGIFACVVGMYLLRMKKGDFSSDAPLPSLSIFISIGFAVAFLANLLGIGGGLFMVPVLLHFHFQERKAIGTSSGTSFLICLGGTIGYFITTKQTDSIPGCLGYIYIPAFITIGLTSAIAAFYGVKLVSFLNPKALRKIFAITMTCVGLIMIYTCLS